jgi:hypothetical protein
LHGEWAGLPATLCVPLTRAALRYRSRSSFFSFFFFLIYVLCAIQEEEEEEKKKP